MHFAMTSKSLVGREESHVLTFFKWNFVLTQLRDHLSRLTSNRFQNIIYTCVSLRLDLLFGY